MCGRREVRVCGGVRIPAPPFSLPCPTSLSHLPHPCLRFIPNARTLLRPNSKEQTRHIVLLIRLSGFCSFTLIFVLISTFYFPRAGTPFSEYARSMFYELYLFWLFFFSFPDSSSKTRVTALLLDMSCLLTAHLAFFDHFYVNHKSPVTRVQQRYYGNGEKGMNICRKRFQVREFSSEFPASFASHVAQM